jgi:DNA primase
MIAKNGRYYCFACGEHGDAIDFIQRWHRTDFKEALNIIADMYNLSFFDEPVKSTPKPETTKEWQARTDKEVKDKYMQFRDAEYDEMCSRYLQAQRIAEATSPAKTGGVFTEAYEKAINDMEYAKGWIDSYNNDMDRIKRGHLYGNSGTFKAL